MKSGHPIRKPTMMIYRQPGGMFGPIKPLKDAEVAALAAALGVELTTDWVIRLQRAIALFVDSVVDDVLGSRSQQIAFLEAVIVDPLKALITKQHMAAAEAVRVTLLMSEHHAVTIEAAIGAIEHSRELARAMLKRRRRRGNLRDDAYWSLIHMILHIPDELGVSLALPQHDVSRGGPKLTPLSKFADLVLRFAIDRGLAFAVNNPALEDNIIDAAKNRFRAYGAREHSTFLQDLGKARSCLRAALGTPIQKPN